MSTIGPAKSIFISSFGSPGFGSWPKLDLGNIGFRFLPWSRHCLQFSARSAIVRCIWGKEIRLARRIIPTWPGWMRCTALITRFCNW